MWVALLFVAVNAYLAPLNSIQTNKKGQTGEGYNSLPTLKGVNSYVLQGIINLKSLIIGDLAAPISPLEKVGAGTGSHHSTHDGRE